MSRSARDVAAGAPATLALAAGIVIAVLARGGFSGVARLGVIGAVAIAVVVTGLQGQRANPSFVVAGALMIAAAAPAAVANEAGRGFVAHGSMALLVAGAAWAAANVPASDRRVLRALVLSSSVVVAVTGWVGVVARLEPWAQVDQELWRAASSVTYANAAATLCAIGWLLAATDRDPFPGRVLDVCGSLCVVGAVATLSRAGLVALAVAAVVILTLKGLSWLAVAMPSLLGGGVASAALLPGLATDGSAQPVVAVVGLLIGLAVAAYAGRVTRPAVLAVGTLGVGVGVAVGLLSLGSNVEGRFSPMSTDRADAWQAAWDEFVADPIFGRGPGELDLVWVREDGPWSIAFVHNEYLEILAETGLVGLALMLAGLAVLVVRGLEIADPSRRALIVAVVVLVALQSFFDFLWHIPAVVVVAGVVIGASRASEFDDLGYTASS